MGKLVHLKNARQAPSASVHLNDSKGEKAKRQVQKVAKRKYNWAKDVLNRVQRTTDVGLC